MDERVDSFLEKIAQIESAGGKYTDHKEMKSGIHKGTSAIGTYGLMPNTVDEIVTRSGNPDLEMLLEMNPKEKKAFIEKNPQVEQALARTLAQHVLDRQGGDEEKAAYSWLYGHNLSPKKIERRDYQEEPYVQKYRNLSSDPKSEFPLSIEGTPEGEKVKKYIDSYSVKDEMTKHWEEQNENMRRAMEIASRGPFSNKTPEEQAFEEKHLDPLTRGLISGGPAGGIGNSLIRESAPAIRGGARAAFDRIRELLKRPVTQEEFLAEQMKNPSVQEVLKDVRRYEPAMPSDPGKIAQIEAAAKRMMEERELEALKQAAKHTDEVTNKIPVYKKRGK